MISQYYSSSTIIAIKTSAWDLLLSLILPVYFWDLLKHISYFSRTRSGACDPGSSASASYCTTSRSCGFCLFVGPDTKGVTRSGIIIQLRLIGPRSPYVRVQYPNWTTVLTIALSISNHVNCLFDRPDEYSGGTRGNSLAALSFIHNIKRLCWVLKHSPCYLVTTVEYLLARYINATKMIWSIYSVFAQSFMYLALEFSGSYFYLQTILYFPINYPAIPRDI